MKTLYELGINNFVKIRGTVLKTFGIPLIAIILGVIFMPVMCCMRCWAKLCCECKKKRNQFDHFENSFDLGKLLTISCVIFISVGIWVILLMWFFQMNSLISSFTRIMCTSIGAFESLNKGYNSDKSRFPGTEGFKFILKAAEDDLDLLTSNSTSAKDVLGRIRQLNLPNSLQIFTKNALDFSELAARTNLRGCSPENPSQSIKSQFLRSISSTIQTSKPFADFYSDMEKYAKAFDSASVNLVELLDNIGNSRTKFKMITGELRSKIVAIQNSTLIVDNFFN